MGGLRRALDTHGCTAHARRSRSWVRVHPAAAHLEPFFQSMDLISPLEP